MRVFVLSFACFISASLLLLGFYDDSFAMSRPWQSGAGLLIVAAAIALQIEGALAIKKTMSLSEIGKQREMLRAQLTETQEKLRLEIERKKNLPPATSDAEVVQLLSLLQEKGRLVDFLMEDVAPYSDQQVGAAARVVHQGCRGVLRDYFAISTLSAEAEGSEITLEEGFSPLRYRLLGRVTQAPYRGTIVHPGWRTAKVKMPTLVADHQHLPQDFRVISPVEIELQ